MSRNFPQATKTKKVSSLPDDLKKLAEDLIAEKFDVKEEVVEREAPRPFRQEYPGTSGPDDRVRVASKDVFIDPHLGQRLRRGEQGFRERIEVITTPWSSRPVATVPVPDPSTHGLRTAITQLKLANIRPRTFYMIPEFMEHLLVTDREFAHYYNRNADTSKSRHGIIYGIDVVVSSTIPGEAILEGEL